MLDSLCFHISYIAFLQCNNGANVFRILSIIFYLYYLFFFFEYFQEFQHLKFRKILINIKINTQRIMLNFKFHIFNNEV